MNIRCMNCMEIFDDTYGVCPHCGYTPGTGAKEAIHLNPGTILQGRYTIGTCLGFGGFGITYIAYDEVLATKVAIKEFYPVGLVNRAPGTGQVGLFSGDKLEEYQGMLERFLLEAQNTAKFSTEPDIVNVFDFFETNGTAYIVMEYIQGTLLKTHIREKGKLSENEALAIITPVMAAVKKIHDAGIIHRDISPDNIFLLPEGGIKIFDFGAAKFDQSENESNMAAVIKTGYAPPEQYRANSKQGFYVDIYAIGAIFYEMVTGQKPLEASDRAIHDDLKRPSQLGIKLSPNIDKAIMKSMAIKPELRFQNISMFRRAVGNETIVDYPEEEIKKIKLRRKILGGVLGSGIVGLAVALVLFLTIWKPDPTIVDYVKKIKPTTLEVCLLADGEKQQETYQEIADKFEETYSSKGIVINLQFVTEKEYETMIRKGGNSLTNIFPVTEHTQETLKSSEADLSLLYRALDGTCMFVSDYENNTMPMSFAVKTVYINELAAAQKEKKDLEEYPDQYSIEELSTLKSEKTYVEYEQDMKDIDTDTVVYLSGNTGIVETVRKLFQGYRMISITENGVAVKEYHDVYAVNGLSDENDKWAAMLFLAWMAQSEPQRMNYMDDYQQHEYKNLPINYHIYQSFAENQSKNDRDFYQKIIEGR